MQRRLLRVDYRKKRLRGACRFARLLTRHFVETTQAAPHGVCVNVRCRGALANGMRGQEIRTEGTRRHYGHLDPEWPHLLCEALRESLYSRLGGRVKTGSRHRSAPRDGSNVDDVPS